MAFVAGPRNLQKYAPKAGDPANVIQAYQQGGVLGALGHIVNAPDPGIGPLAIGGASEAALPARLKVGASAIKPAASAAKGAFEIAPAISGSGGTVFHEIKQAGKPALKLTMSFLDPKRTAAHIDSIVPVAGSGIGPNAIGPGLIKQLFKQFRSLYPDVKHISGLRTTGMRGKGEGAKLMRLTLPGFLAALGLGKESEDVPKRGASR